MKKANWRFLKLNDDIPPSPIDFPAKIQGIASASYSVEHQKITLDAKVFPPCSNKIEDIGRFKKKKFRGVCDGKGHLNFKQIMDPFEKLDKLKKACEKGLITQEEFDSKKKDILDTEI